MPRPGRQQSVISGLPQQQSQQLFASATHVKLAADQTLFLAGDSGDGCYRVEKGLLKVTMHSANGDERILAILGPGAIVGELAMLDGLPRSASVVGVRDAELLFISRAKFEDVTDQSELAALAGIARENVNRILADWKRRKLVSRLSGYYCIENPGMLEKEADH